MEKPNVLLVDDDPDFVEAIRLTLEKSGFKVVSAGDGEEGLRQAKKVRPHLVILDVMMPKMDGYAVCHELKSNEMTSHIPILVLTSLGNRSDGKDGAEILAKGHQAEAYLEKPVEPEVLLEKAKALIEASILKPEKKIKVLLIDDDPDFIAGVKTVLE